MAKTASQEKAKTAPEKNFGPYAGGIGLAVWLNETEGEGGEIRHFRSITFNPRRYRDEKSGGWKDAASYRVSDLPALAFGLQRAIEYCFTEPLPGQGHEDDHS